MISVDWIGFGVASVAVVLAPGPGSLFVAKTATTAHVRDGLLAMLGSLPFRRAVAITLLNPKAVFFFMAFFPVFIKSAQDGLVVPYATMTLVFMSISATYLSFLIHASSKLALAFQQNRTLPWVARNVCGCVFIGFGLKVAMVSR